VGRAIIPKRTDAASQVFPDGRLKVTRMKFVRTTRPKNPYTTDGIPASSSIAGLRIVFIREGASSAMKIAQPMESGTAKTIEPMVTRMVPTISGKIPYSGTAAVGSHDNPSRKSGRVTCCRIGKPSRTRKRRMRIMAITAKKAVRKNRLLINCSLIRDLRALPIEEFLNPNSVPAILTIFTPWQKEKN